MAEIPALVEARLRSAFGEPDARAAVTFLGTDRIEVLRFTEGDLVRYATLGMSAHPMTDPTAVVADPVRGPRAELVLTVRAGLAPTDKVLRPLAVLAASPVVEGLVVAPAPPSTWANRCGRGHRSPRSSSRSRADWSRTWNWTSRWTPSASCRCCR